MKKSIIHTPHDKLFKSSLQYPEVAREFLELFLPDDIKKQLDFNSITYCQTTFLDEQLKLSQTDVLFQCRVANHPAYIYILAEQESEVDALIAFWLIKYLVAIWDWHIKQVGERKALPLPLIFPLVFYTGDKPYTACKHLWELFGEQSEEMKMILQSPFYLIEAGKIPEETLTSHVYAGTMGFILRKCFRKHIKAELRKIIDNLNSLDSENHRYVLDLVRYIFNIDEGHRSAEELMTIVRDKMSPNLEKTMSSLAEKLIAEGELRGETRGKIEGEMNIIMKMLANGVEPAFIAANTGFPIHKIKELEEEAE
jgi:recombination-promoting nuclease RpnD